ncbi:hypothetical protein [Ruegeria arenilitoris]|nr:hypothetical protein [Ruegeria arenilitoris]
MTMGFSITSAVAGAVLTISKKGPAIALANAQYRGGHGYVAAQDA